MTIGASSGKSHGRRSLVRAAVHGVAKSWTRLSDFTFTFHFHALEKEMATHSCSCLENPRDGGVWLASVYEVTQSRTRLKRFSSSNGSVGKESACKSGDTGDAGLIPGSGKSPGGGNGNSFQYFCLTNHKDRGAW